MLRSFPASTWPFYFLWESDRSPIEIVSVGYVAAAGFLLGLSMLTKGLIGVAIVGVAYGSYVLITRRLSVEICSARTGRVCNCRTCRFGMVYCRGNQTSRLFALLFYRTACFGFCHFHAIPRRCAVVVLFADYSWRRLAVDRLFAGNVQRYPGTE